MKGIPMDLHKLAVKASKVFADNSPVILTALGVTGVLTTAYFTGKASLKAADVIAAKQFRVNLDTEVPHHDLTSREKFDLVWKLYIPAVGSAATTCTCIILANRIGTRRAAAMAAAYTISERAFVEYKDKVIEKFGETREREVRDEVIQDRVRRDYPNSEVFIVGTGETLCHDKMSGRFFKSSMEAIKRAQNDINYKVLREDYATVTDFYAKIGLEPTTISDELGWNTTEGRPMEISFAPILAEEDTPCLSFEFATIPIREPWRFC